MRTFCTEGPIEKKRNYFVPRRDLIQEGLKKVDEWRYFTIFAPRQSGKTTFFQMLIEQIRVGRKDCFALWVTFESFGDVSLKDFFFLLNKQIEEQLGTELKIGESIPLLETYLQHLTVREQKKLVLIIDEIEGLKNVQILNSLLHTIRSIYHRKENVNLQSVILTGVSNIMGILQDSASPFNIADQISLPYFSREEVYDLLHQHEKETGQLFDDEVKAGIYENTRGQPGLVNALARDLVEKKCPNGEDVALPSFYKTLDDFTRVYIDKNISNIVSKAKQHPQFMKELLFGKEILFNTYDETIKYLSVNGVIADCNGYCCIPIPLYKKALYKSFEPKMNGEVEHYTSPFFRLENFLDEEGGLKVKDLLHNYSQYIKRRGNILFNHPNEGEYQYNLDGYLHSICTFLGAEVYPEVKEGGGNVDLLILKNGKKWIIETKRFINTSYYEQGKRQLREYLKRSGETEGYGVYFSEVHEQEEYRREEIGGSILHLWIIPVHRPNPSTIGKM